MKRSLGLFLVALVVGAASAGEAVMPITECRVTVPPNQKAVLQNDVVCGHRCTEDRATICRYEGDPVCSDGRGSCEAERIIVQRGAVLDLAKQITAGDLNANGVRCGAPGEEVGRCVIKGPGSIRGGDPPIYSDGMDIVARKLTLSGAEEAVRTGGRLVLEDVDLGDYTEFGLEGRSIKLKNVRAHVERIYSHGDLELDHVELARFTYA